MAFSLPPTLTDTLSAVNVMLSSVGEAPVTALDATQAADVQAALIVLAEVNRAVQSKGWPFNRDYQLLLPPSSDGTIPLPDNCLRITKSYPGPGYSGRAVERNRKLYDPGLHSSTFTAPVSVDMISLLAFEGLPETARRYVTIRAAKQFQGRVQTSAGVDRILDEEVAAALVALEDEVDESEGYNAIYGNAEVQYRITGRGLRRRY